MKMKNFIIFVYLGFTFKSIVGTLTNNESLANKFEMHFQKVIQERKTVFNVSISQEVKNWSEKGEFI